MLIKNKTILAIAPHLDDVELGAGGAVSRLSTDNDVYYLGLSLPPDVQRPLFLEEYWASAGVLGLKEENVKLYDFDPRDLAKSRADILQLLYDFNQTYKPEVVLVPNGDDVHQSHKVVNEEARRVFKATTLLGYELPWNNFSFKTDVYFELGEENLLAKQRSLACFKSQAGRGFFNNDIVTDMAKFRGKQVGKRYCECFELIRLML